MSDAGRTPRDGGSEIFDAECYRCGAEEDLVEDATFAGLMICGRCLERVETQNEMIARGLEDEPGVAP